MGAPLKPLETYLTETQQCETIECGLLWAQNVQQTLLQLNTILPHSVFILFVFDWLNLRSIFYIKFQQMHDNALVRTFVFNIILDIICT